MSKPFEKHIKDRPYAKPETAAARLLEIAKTLRIDEGRMPIGEWNSTFIWKDKASVEEYTLGRDKLIADGIIKLHECGGFFMWKDQTPEGELPGTGQPHDA
ncbi:hypothetical protein [Tardiphaga sp. 709]|uniref:hypothetical protein n=1 Tax=Tardiphaga sp. 709 TaxID=3076039 RepID=UPI0028E38A2C|nr:hypothetical protein [Tardiphaga sp. 709]WNV12769.1 hypothetical protein RSO67_30270 [Tardiphaga sp. 709]